MVLPNYNDSTRHSPRLAAPLRTKFRACLPTQSPLPGCTRPATVNGPGQGPNSVLPIDNDSARHSPKLAAPLRTKFQGQPADSEPSARLYRHVRGVTTDTLPRTLNGQQPMPTCAADLPTCRSSTDQVTARPPQIGNHPTGSVTSPACRSRRTRPPTASSTDTEECWAPTEGSISQAIQSPNRRSRRAPNYRASRYDN